MDIEAPTLEQGGDRTLLHMFCLENRIARELCWAGFGFQVWCQMLTYILDGASASLLAIDEPDIYLHSDLQRQLLGILKELGPDIMIATHSTELVSDAEPNDIVVITKRARSGKRLRDPSQLQSVFSALGSNLNPTLTQLAKTKRALFVEGRDFHIIAQFAARLGFTKVANRAAFAVIPAEGFNPQRVAALADGIDATLGAKVLRAAIFDRDFRCDLEITSVLEQLRGSCGLARIHSLKEIENFLLVPAALERAVRLRLLERERRGGGSFALDHDVGDILDEIAQSLRLDAQSQFVSSFVRYQREKSDASIATLTRQALEAWEVRSMTRESRLGLLPGKELFSRLNGFLNQQYAISLTVGSVIRSFSTDEILPEMIDLVTDIDRFASATTD
jgi:hypothetical protein